MIWVVTVVLHVYQTGSGVTFTNAYYGSGSGSVQFGNVQCNGNENDLLDCPNAVSYTHLTLPTIYSV